MNKRTPLALAIISVVLLIGPPIVYVYIVFPYAERQPDPDGIEFIGFYFGALLVVIGLIAGAVAIAMAAAAAASGGSFRDLDSKN